MLCHVIHLLVKDGQVGHVFLLLELGGIAIKNLGLGKDFILRKIEQKKKKLGIGKEEIMGRKKIFLLS